jgi:hypothetical protein
MKRADVAIFENLAWNRSGSVNDQIHHDLGQVVSPDYLIGK